MEDIRVHIVKFKDRKNWMMRYLDPETGKHIARSTGTTKKKEAERVAAKWEAELQEGRYHKPSRMSWDEFREKFDELYLPGVELTTAGTYETSLNVFQRCCRPTRLAQVDNARLTGFVNKLRADGLANATIARHIRTLKLAMRWAHQQGYLVKLPNFPMPKGVKGMKGRPITSEEFERMLAAVPKAIKARPSTDGRRDVEQWRFFLRGLWWSGLRLTESLELRWDDAPGALVPDFSGRRPMLRIPAESEKGNKHRLLPMAPEFAELLQSIPERRRRGHVFRIPDSCPRTTYSVCRRIVATGEAANVVVKRRQKKGKTVLEYASAHDLRRSFGFRWSRLVMPTILRELMRHESIETTMTYYVGQQAEATADELWRAVGHTSGNSECRENDETLVF